MKRASKFSPEVQERAVRIVVEAQGQHGSQWAAIESIAAKIGCTAETSTPSSFTVGCPRKQVNSSQVPRPRLHLIRFHGVLAPNAKLRRLAVPQAPQVQEQATEAAAATECEVETVQARPQSISWARLLIPLSDQDELNYGMLQFVVSNWSRSWRGRDWWT